jgi:predicted butyrate kinase (DUF1464 family)
MAEEAESGRNDMSLSIGVSCGRENWKTCLMENGQALERNSFVDSVAARAYLEHTCTLYPEPTIVLSSDLSTPFTRLVTVPKTCLEEMIPRHYTSEQRETLQELLIAIGYRNINSYFAPSVRYLSSMPPHRKLMRENLGTANNLCAVAALLKQLRAREAEWSEMNFLCLEVDHNSRSILVVEDGRIVNGMSSVARTEDQLQEASQQAFWEGLKQELAGFVAIHHFEDIVVMGQLKDAFIERFADSYQVYHFPYSQPDYEGFEAASGAAAIAEGLYGQKARAEIVERLQIREAPSSFPPAQTEKLDDESQCRPCENLYDCKPT